ncbi:prepilin-type N-terminal cleavage/methylation domain-containing protein [Bacillus thuringiensis]|uniref:prepilin-type N-terminal cleavage/methylation domain-containing protein n=1 Tax=Bacillus thuringiensis TaxID=1428 RepID=UPI0021D6968A|nr:prepilin-type N-terminal cleavage/methylation domain-containing protein [Bacillus thuringiensis]MCU7667082.1 prepilin-type N-terminal cleavage/methylation domain-containing protein [Bacillus thuringiensis]
MIFLKKCYSSIKEAVKNERGFTLLELIAVIAILAIIAAISFTAFSTQGEKARVSAHKTNVVTIEQAAARYETEKGFKDTDFSYVDESHKLVKEGFLKEFPKNPWETTNKDQKGYKYIITKDKRGMFFAYLAEVPTTGSTVTKIVVVDSSKEEATPKAPGTAPDAKFVSTALDPNAAADNDRFYKGK